MIRSLHVGFVLMLAGAFLAAGLGQPPVSYNFEPSMSEMSVEGGSTLHDWSCPIESISGSLDIDTAQTGPGAPIAGLSGTQVSVPVDAIQCDKDTMNEKLREALQMNSYPEVYFSLKDAQVSALPDSGAAWFQVNATGQMILAGERRQVELPVKGKKLDNGNLRLTGSHTIRLSDYDIERPSAMLGTITVSKDVTVNFDVTATPESNE